MNINYAFVDHTSLSLIASDETEFWPLFQSKNQNSEEKKLISQLQKWSELIRQERNKLDLCVSPA